ncbi:MAG: YcgN family cysteine cluster protein [gamma proteobacterium symbiont of Bathyaustriella thionipta]|nr:YcgN family cysteine cluster protein [gamma proteobacterium symbiont of Bathyaustriella thionipta]MCU7949344.1 YcgN family cysteine cluster protein [gamma proteobacterium symbiont of Bathyaustriella thionipta]MCU7952654.1 YcgN family cysteine cluster protein [gamma proteobacterium symbiont of Bathyaustriella thionipta]MCU7955531.1 YcgN family cysteine cluster protein [gamma proteobacterium symbiont of Bathyaustriella thionipta]MCU7968583.1 YcgN family cysteine cluster protein [gamma proteoba
MANFWEYKTLYELTRNEWEQLCDGCAKCCLHKIEDEDTGIIYSTNVVCQYLDIKHCLCENYAQRSVLVPECVTLDSDNLEQVYFMPTTCSYRLLAEGKPLPSWHPLLTHNKESVHESGNSVRGKVISELETDDLMHHLTGEWD